ncbi:MAG: Alanine--tRNA ligase [uncultured marine phage]|uniref:Alanine--tRNA ligase n=1 Tax=uncultured marine phage TaxID=707152 RepID=A0A8D9C869_9VIRU|nr:MAG: Alanine--tRNA ligase [uncultured marine phage]
MDDNIRPHDDTTLFCPAGMQQYKNTFKSDYVGSVSNVQSCLRLKDLEEVGDGTHFLYFNMIGLFSFREMSVQESIDFWMEFLEEELKLKVDYVTIHPDKIEDWSSLYDNYEVEIREDEECIWSDGEIGGYCTEFYIDDVEIGNIVNPLGDCIDVGFGLERLESFVNKVKEKTKEEILIETCDKMIFSGYFPSNKKQGYVLKKLLRELYRLGSDWDNEYYQKEKERQRKVIKRYHDIKDRPKYKDKSKEWWFDTMGVDIDFVNSLK